ncbi:bacteriocin-like protein [Chryseobacterium taeanense]|uniref:bacteriocin-like protein n=1 Tax=Chryseobacterium taeanense TaxID=311334 RepID=UPI000B7CA037|nr:hypothetical protein [Chryseobacterium taeanense]
MKNLKKLSRNYLRKIDGGKKINFDPSLTTCYNVTYCYQIPGDVMGSTGIPVQHSGSEVPSGATNVMPCGYSPVYPVPAECGSL